MEGLSTILEMGLVHNLLKHDVVMLVETFRTTSTTMPGFYVFESLALKTNNRRGRPSLGILIGVKPWLAPRLVYESKFCLAVSSNAGNIVYVVIFRRTVKWM